MYVLLEVGIRAARNQKKLGTRETGPGPGLGLGKRDRNRDQN